MLLYLISGDVVKLPVTLTPDQSCSDKFMELVQPTEVGTSVLYKGVEAVSYIHLTLPTTPYV